MSRGFRLVTFCHMFGISKIDHFQSAKNPTIFLCVLRWCLCCFDLGAVALALETVGKNKDSMFVPTDE